MGLDDTTLVLGLALGTTDHVDRKPKKPTNFEPSLTLALSGETNNHGNIKIVSEAADLCHHHHRQASPHSQSAVSSFSNVSVKRERDLGSDEVIKLERLSCDEDEDGANARKKLRLTKEQSGLLEESFKQHSTLNPKQKQALARQLSLRPRQVEVWFQNRRARTKLKQTEVECELLKKCCETLTEENRRLQKEVSELKALKRAQPLYMHMPPATLTMCPSCAGADVPSNNATTHFYNHFTNPSAAC